MMDSTEELEQYGYIWNGTQNWALVTAEIPSAIVTIEFEGDSPNAREIVALRKAVSQFHDKSYQDIRKQLGQTKSIDIGNFTGCELHYLIPQIKQHGLSVKITEISYSGYIPYHVPSGVPFIRLALDNATLCALIAEKLLLKGIPIFEITFEFD
jgi:hypothetical protein